MGKEVKKGAASWESLSERDRDFLRGCRMLRESKRATGMTGKQISHRVADGEAPGYYLTYEHAMRIVRHGVGSERKGSVARRRAEELTRRVENVSRRRRLDRGNALRLVLESKASCFFMPYERAEKLYYKYFKTTNKRGGKKYVRNIDRRVDQ